MFGFQFKEEPLEKPLDLFDWDKAAREREQLKTRRKRITKRLPLGIKALLWMDEMETKGKGRPTLTAAGKRFKCHRTTVSRHIKKELPNYQTYITIYGDAFPGAKLACEMRAEYESYMSEHRAANVHDAHLEHAI